MGWLPIDRLIEALRDRLAADPAGVRHEVSRLLEDGAGSTGRMRPSSRLRLLGLVVAASWELGELARAETAAAEGLKISTRSAVANADFLLQVGVLRIVQKRPRYALEVVNRAGLVLGRELQQPPPTAKESRRRRRWLQATKAASKVIRGEIFLHLSEGSFDEAFADALEALKLTEDLVKASAHTRRVHLSAVTLLCALLVRFGPIPMAQEALPLLDHAEGVLIYQCRISPDSPDHPHRIKVKWGRALVLARLGETARAERLLIDVTGRLHASGLKDDAGRALDALVWVIEQTKSPGRAGYFVLKYGK